METTTIDRRPLRALPGKTWPGHLRPQARLVLDLLVEKRGQIVTFDDLYALDPGFLSLEHIRVIMHEIRSTIHGNVYPVRNHGYIYYDKMDQQLYRGRAAREAGYAKPVA